MVQKTKIKLIVPPYRGASGFPLGLYYIAGNIEEKNGVKVDVVDLAKVDKGMLDHHLDGDIYGFTTTTPTYRSCLKIAKYIKQKNPTAIIVFGGYHATLAHRTILETHSYVDIIIKGEGENVFSLLIDAIINKLPLKDVPAITYREEVQVVSNDTIIYNNSLDSLPFVNREKAHLYSIEIHNSEGEKSTSIITSRGCPYACNFCSAKTMMGPPRFRSVKNVIDELINLNQMGFKSIYIEDDNFVSDKKRVENICDEIIKRKFNFKWFCKTRLDNLDYPILQKMKDANCDTIFFGIESGDLNMLKKLGKGGVEFKKKAEEVFSMCREAGIKTLASIIVGYLGETENSIDNTISFLKKLNPNKIWLNLATIFPKTVLAQELCVNDLVFEKDNNFGEFDQWRIQNSHCVGAILTPYFTGLTAEEYSNLHNLSESKFNEISDNCLKNASYVQSKLFNELGRQHFKLAWDIER